MEVSDIDFYDGDDTVYHTGWKNTEINFADFDKKVITIDFIIYDVGDSLFDSACLIDNIQIQ